MLFFRSLLARAGATVVFATCALLCAPDAWAQSSPTVNTFTNRPGGDPEGTFWLHSGKTIAPGLLQTWSWFGYALNPLIGREDGSKSESVVSHQAAGQIVLNTGLTDSTQVGLSLPVVLFQSGQDIGRRRSDLNTAAFGDLELVPKFQLFSADEAYVDIAFLPTFTLPTAGNNSFAGESTLAFVPQLAVSGRKEIVDLFLNVGYRARRNVRALDLELGDEILYRLGSRIDVDLIPQVPFFASAELAGAIRAADPFGRIAESPLEGLVGGGISVPAIGVTGYLHAGGGIVPGYGSPSFRILMGARYEMPIPGTRLFLERKYGAEARAAGPSVAELAELEALCKAVTGRLPERLSPQEVVFVDSAARIDEARSAVALDALAKQLRCQDAMRVVELRVRVPSSGAPGIDGILAESRAQNLLEALRRRSVPFSRFYVKGEVVAEGASGSAGIRVSALQSESAGAVAPDSGGGGKE